MSSSNVDVDRIVDAVKEDPDLSSKEKEFNVYTVKDGSPTEKAEQFDQHMTAVESSIGSLTRRLLRHPQFTVDSLRVRDQSGTIRNVDPANLSAGRVTGVKGYFKTDARKFGELCRDAQGIADLLPYDNSGSATMGLPSQNRLADISRGALREPWPQVGRRLRAVDQATTEASSNTSGGEEGTPTFTDPLEF